MIDDLKTIKKYYGENMMHLCRELFSTIIDKEPGKVSKIILDHFDKSKILYDDIKDYELEDEFKYYINSFIEDNYCSNLNTDKTPEELLKEVGYTLYECKTEEEIQEFKKYYALGERLCTFNGNRLKRCRVFFAVKDNALELKRKNFENPKRQDEYGTSVISIQFSKDSSHTLSIKNRYNHTVDNPDATFSNNLDNIVPGLTKSFEKYYDLKQRYIQRELEIPYYVVDKNGKYYKFNIEIDNIYYCVNNVIIDKFKKKEYEKEKYIVMDYFILDLVNKKIYLYDDKIEDDFVNSFGEIKKIKIEKNNKDQKKVIVTPIEGEDIIVTLDNQNQIIGLINNNLTKCKDNFLYFNELISEVSFKKLQAVGDNFLGRNENLKIIKFPALRKVGHDFLFNNEYIEMINLPRLKKVGDNFLYYSCVQLYD